MNPPIGEQGFARMKERRHQAVLAGRTDRDSVGTSTVSHASHTRGSDILSEEISSGRVA